MQMWSGVKRGAKTWTMIMAIEAFVLKFELHSHRFWSIQLIFSFIAKIIEELNKNDKNRIIVSIQLKNHI
jgi:hypothetical protein